MNISTPSSSLTEMAKKRIMTDIRRIMKQPLTDQGIYYCHDEENLQLGYAMIIGPEDTPYFGGYYFFKLTFPSDYPFSPPSVKYCTNGENIRFHPNLYACGKVCLSLINTWSGEQWSSCQSITTVLLTLCSILTKDPLIHEPGTQTPSNISAYNECVEYYNLKTAVGDILMRTTGIYQPFFDMFRKEVLLHFQKNYEKWMEFARQKQGERPPPYKLYLEVYSMKNITIDYNALISKLEQCRTQYDAEFGSNEEVEDNECS